VKAGITPKRIKNIPDSAGAARTNARGLGGEGLTDAEVQTLTSHRFAGGPLLSPKKGRGIRTALFPTARGHGFRIESAMMQ
jgi:hypothetical protein